MLLLYLIRYLLQVYLTLISELHVRYQSKCSSLPKIKDLNLAWLPERFVKNIKHVMFLSVEVSVKLRPDGWQIHNLNVTVTVKGCYFVINTTWFFRDHPVSRYLSVNLLGLIVVEILKDLFEILQDLFQILKDLF